MFVLTVIVVIVTAAAFVMAGYGKVRGTPQQVDIAERLRIEWSAYRLVGVAELLGSLGLLIGLWLSWLGVVAAICLVVLTAGALVSHLRVEDTPKEMLPAFVYLLLGLLTLSLRLTTL